MSKLRKVMLYVLSAALTVCAAFFVAACAGYDSYADFINPSAPVKPNPGNKEFTGDYTIEVTSAGGLNLSGIKVSAMLNNEVIAEGISVDGKIELTLDPAEYTLVVDESTLPTGYFIADGTTFKTSAADGKAEVKLSSAVISQSTPPGTRYSMGDVMYDFAFTDANTGERSSLSEVFKTKKAVVINFWYKECNPCRSEFPAMQSAYANFSDDIEIIGLNNHDSQTDIKNFRREFGLSFIMAQDGAGMHGFFNVAAWPTTVIIDRFGAIAFWDSTGAITQTSTWVAMFTTFTSDDYQQSGTDEGGNGTHDWARPGADVKMPSSADIEQAINGSGTAGKVGNYRLGESEDAQKDSWPWLLGEDGDGKYLYSPNIGKNYSYSTLYVDFDLKSGDIISYEYSINSEVDCDFLHVLLVDLEDASNNKRLASYSGDSQGWTTETLYTANRPIKITLAFTYIKDQLQGPSEGDEIAAIKNIRIITAADITVATDLVTPAVSGTLVGGKYEHYENVKLNPADGYYHLYNAATDTYGALLLADILDATMWSSNVVGKNTFINDENSTTTASLYLLSYWTMSNYKKAVDEGGLLFTYDKTKDMSITDTVITNYYLQSFSDNGYVPVTAELKAAIDAFTAEYCRVNDKDYYEEQWLELCYYFIHYGDPHKDGDPCYVNDDPIFGLTRKNAYTAVEGTAQAPAANHVNVTKIITIDGGGGLYFKFEPKQTGIYRIYTNSSSEFIDPLIWVRTPEGKGDDSFIAELDDDMRPDKFTKKFYENVDGYVYFEAGTTYYLQCRFHQLQNTGEYDFFLEYTGKTSYDYLRFATTGEGLWTYTPSGFTYYIAVDRALGTDNYYYALNPDGSYGSKIYIDFIHPQYYDMNNHTLKQIIDEGYFDLTRWGGKTDYTDAMNQYYQQAIAKDKDDELYGLVEASYALVYLISNYLEIMHGEKIDTGYWMSFACYYEHIGK